MPITSIGIFANLIGELRVEKKNCEFRLGCQVIVEKCAGLLLNKRQVLFIYFLKKLVVLFIYLFYVLIINIL